MRQIFLDTETTGLEAKLGHRIIEIGAVEMLDRRLTGSNFHHYLNPERLVESGALQVHGLTNDFLQDKQKFLAISNEFLEFISDSELIMHNAPFDSSFLNNELALAKLQSLENYCHSITDTLKMARKLHPGKRNNLDALCDRYQINNSKRVLHGALLDAQLLAEVYLAMTRGQESLAMEISLPKPNVNINVQDIKLVSLQANIEELNLHNEQLELINQESQGTCLWKRKDS
ncbi:MAG: DNA polymerase III subunit epsilon [Nitrosomonadaceae bacterium]|nr:DNA polymerase III subunit epsilon [Nitrosomonadaceae bacterium]|tara:strand:+ start:1461 stop:2153 length:693 start_codon:yes stop_codon:yes gene_type:complete